MNIFVIDNCPVKCAEFLDDKRVVKMVLETAQLLSTALREHGYDGDKIYRSTHRNHPCAVWVRSTKQNYMWTMRYFRALCYEYYKRYGRTHKSSLLYADLLDLAHFVPDGEMTEFVNCAANDGLGISFKHMSDTFKAYKLYLNKRWDNDKRIPTWYGEAA